MAERVVPLRLAQIPNALTIARFAAIPVFVAFLLTADQGQSWPAAVIFALAGATDQLDGWLARRWHVESRFGTVADPLADRLMIDTAVIGLFLYDRLPWPALVLILARDLVLLAGYKLIAPRGYELSVSFAGKAATWILYASLTFMLATPQGTDFPLVLFWIGLALSLVAGAAYVAGALRGAR
ncbi:MAG TPA: CDP-alcohol phosphatidyltransferase family protein [Gaiellaceae bacterium]|jgi:CDP-diacylglycerol--glycerol-3-phosphate 3-phosphatidyltransferase|nr:CDP-alcohol phosphatidyltransferase family protein [Gaiellaceae bacterium]